MPVLRVLAVSCLFAATGVQAQVYKCVDSLGITHYSDEPLPECKGVKVDIQAQPPISGSLRPSGEPGLAEQERAFRRRQVERDRAEQKEASARAARQRRCEQQRAQLDRFTSRPRAVVVDGKGERRYMDDDVRAAKIAELEAGVARDCH